MEILWCQLHENEFLDFITCLNYPFHSGEDYKIGIYVREIWISSISDCIIALVSMSACNMVAYLISLLASITAVDIHYGHHI